MWVYRYGEISHSSAVSEGTIHAIQGLYVNWRELAVMDTGMLALSWTEDISVKETYTTWTSVDMSLSL